MEWVKSEIAPFDIWRSDIDGCTCTIIYRETDALYLTSMRIKGDYTSTVQLGIYSELEKAKESFINRN